MADNFNLRQFLSENKLTKNAQLLKEEEIGENVVSEASYFDYYDSEAANEVGRQLTSIVDIFTKGGQQEREEIDAAIAAAEQATGTQVTPSEKRALLSHAGWIRTHRMEMERESVDNKKPVMENLTAKERRLVEMVQDALGITEEENVDYTMGRADDPDQLPNPPAQLNIPEGDESIEEAKPLPKYNSIEELMKEIEHGTNKAAHKYKMEEMKRVYEALEAKVGSLEEGEHAEHIDQKAIKQMRKDIAALRKAEEKLRKEFEKKFTGKEKKETPKKEKEVAALQEESFDLRKFLVESKLTTNSRMLKEEFAPSTAPIQGIEDATYTVGEAFKKAGIDMSKPVVVIHSETGDTVRQDPNKTVSELEKLRQEYSEEFEEGNDFPVFYEYDNNTVLASEMPEGVSYKLAVAFFEAEDYSILQ